MKKTTQPIAISSSATKHLPAFLMCTLTILGCSSNETTPTESTSVNSTAEQLDDTAPITVLHATYGFRCGVQRDNVLNLPLGPLDWCAGTTGSCDYPISENNLGDPARGCDKDFDIDWACGPQFSLTSRRQSLHVSQEANGKGVSLVCNTTAPDSGTIVVTKATYGDNCGAATNNILGDVQGMCNGWTHCKYIVSEATVGDPARGCDKEVRGTYQCSNAPGTDKPFQVPAEANGSYASLDCP